MIIAVPYIDGQVDGHFGRTEAFLIARAEAGAVVESEVRGVAGLQHDHGGLAGFLRDQGVSVVLAGGMGGPMQQALKGAGFELYCGVSGDATAAVDAFLRGEIEQSDASCGHH
jgi:predicted Fe-Mo cluster-binding NifX family protein